jgi:hypothetical protein
MTSLSNAVPLSAHRESLQRYRAGIAFKFDSVAGQIIAERLAAGYVRAPLRASLLLWACSASGGALPDALPVAAAFDLFDRFILLHDELSEESSETVARWGLGQSLNAGDALYAVAFRTLASDVGAPGPRLEAARLVAEAVLEAIEGHDGTGRCALTGAALRAGAVIAGASAEVAQAFERAGRTLGMASEAEDTQHAQRLAREAIALLRPYTRHDELETFSEAALDIARRPA